ncbi:MAG TPA: MOSC domain-containing protein [Chloroflexota bacterium]|nr:MOSC domain-containing protein [Chloroflexota bacterium]
MSAAVARVLSVNVGSPRTFETARRAVTSGIWKSPVVGRVRARGVNLDGDAPADRVNHGGPHKAIYAYATEDLAFWEHHLGRQLEPGAFGENLTTVGIDPNAALIGERWAIGSSVLEVSEPRSPCYKLGLRHADPTLVRAFVAAQRPGAYLRIIQAGDIGAGDSIEVVWRPDHDVTICLAFQAWLVDRSLVSRLRRAPQLPPAWKHWIDADPERPVTFE